MDHPAYLSAAAAAAELNVSTATLYAYVSRGMIRSETVPGSRHKRYRAEDVRALKQGRGPTAPGEAPPGGSLVFDSAISLIAEGRLFYRGVSALELAETATLEETASLLWQVSEDVFQRAHDPYPGLPDLPSGLDVAERMMALLPLAQALDPSAYTMHAPALARTGARIVVLLAGIAAGRPWSSLPVHRILAEGWAPDQKNAEALIRAALVLLADHEFNVSAFTLRCVMSARSPLHAGVAAALAALQGPRHGGMVAQVETVLAEIGQIGKGGAADILRQRLKRGDRLAGFGHPLYPQGDPRARVLLALMAKAAPRDEAVLAGQALIAAAEETAGEKPNIDSALAILVRHLRLPAGSGFALFAVARSIGWIAHAIEQIGRPELIRPRARYTGPAPND